MVEVTKDQVFTAISIIILLFTAMINWNIYSWLILAAIILIVIAWYIRNKQFGNELASRALTMNN